jgi:hypothetical protein
MQMAKVFGIIEVADVAVSAGAGRASVGLFMVLMLLVVDEGDWAMDGGFLLARCEFEGRFGKCDQAIAKEQCFEVTASSWPEILVFSRGMGNQDAI